MMSDTISFKGFFNTVVSISLIVRRNDLIPNNRWINSILTKITGQLRVVHITTNVLLHFLSYNKFTLGSIYALTPEGKQYELKTLEILTD
jgi:hypothetical protein